MSSPAPHAIDIPEFFSGSSTFTDISTDIVVIKINDVYFHIKPELLYTAKNYHITVNFTMSENSIELFKAIIEENRDINEIFSRNKVRDADAAFTFYDLYTAIRLCELVGLREHSKQKLDNVFDLYSPTFNIKGVEYLYSIMLIRPSAVNWDKYFRYDAYPYSALVGALTLPEYRDNIKYRIKLIEFFENFDTRKIFEDSNDETQLACAKLKKQREEISEFFAVDPHDILAKNPAFMTFEPTILPDRMIEDLDVDLTESMWGCEVTGVKLPTAGQSSITNIDTFIERFDEYTHGLFKKSPNPEVEDGEEFPWQGVVIAGGSIMQMLRNDYRPRKNSDIDMFIVASDYKASQDILKKLIRWWSGPKTYFGIRSSVIYLYIEDIPRSFQIICTSTKTPYQLISRFDTSQIQCCFFQSEYYNSTKFPVWSFAENTIQRIKPSDSHRQGKIVLCTTEAIKTFNTGLAILNPVSYGGSNPKRLIKCLISGFNIKYNKEFCTTVTDIGLLYKSLATNPAYNETINELHTYWYPSTTIQNSEIEADKTKYYFGMIQKQNACTITTKDPLEVLNKTVLNGNFQVDYDSNAFNTFQMSTIRFINPRSQFRTYVCSNVGAVVLLSPYCKVIGVENLNGDLTINLRIEDQTFIDFINNIVEGTMLRIYTAQAPTKRILTGNCMTVNIAAGRVRMAELAEKSLLKNSKGEPLDIYENIVPEINLKFMFKIHVHVNNFLREVTLEAVRFVSEAVEVEETNADEDIDDKIPAETAVPISNPEFAEICHD